MPISELRNYRSRGARALVLLHERAMRELLPVWRQALASNIRLPATDDPSYASLDTLLHHALRAARGYITWLCEKLALPDPGVQEVPEPDRLTREVESYLEHLLARWRAALAGVEDSRFEAIHKTRWGEDMSLGGMLEHAAMHPIRHRFQLEELLEAQGSG
jgi:uncharacterized damage-inducible protein DinB